MNENFEKLANLIKKSNNIVFFGGAGVSTESNIPDFRSKDGLYALKSKYDEPYEVMLSHTYFMNNTTTFYKFYKEFMIHKEAKPNFTHKFIAKLEKTKNVTVITQNIDGLHQEAGSKNVIELHGSIHRNYCMKCQRFYNLDDILNIDSIVPFCPVCHGVIKPDVVLYEEGLDENNLMRSINAIASADLIIICGTSLNVYPANGLIYYANTSNIVIINKDYLSIEKNCLMQINDSASKVFEEVDKLL